MNLVKPFKNYALSSFINTAENQNALVGDM